MKKLSQILLVLAVGGWFTQTAQAAEDDPVKLAPKNYRVVLNNDKVRVIDVRIKPGQKMPMHSHPDYLVYAVENGTVMFWDEHGKSSKVHLRAGQWSWRNDETHSVQNVGKHTIHVYNVELKGVRLF